jgi:hypothetical protein
MLVACASAGAKIPCRERVRIYEVDHLERFVGQMEVSFTNMTTGNFFELCEVGLLIPGMIG